MNLLSKLMFWWVSFSAVSLFKDKNNPKPNPPEEPEPVDPKKQKSAILSKACWRDSIAKDISKILWGIVRGIDLSKKFDVIICHKPDSCVVKVFLLDPPESRFEDFEGKDGIPFFEVVVVSHHSFYFSAIGRSGMIMMRVDCCDENILKEQMEGAFLSLVYQLWTETPQARKIADNL